MKIVAIGDMHAHPGYNLKHFRAAGEFCAEEQPDVIVQIGDWADVSSINSHGSKLEREGSRWKRDAEVTRESLAEFMRPILRRKRKLPRRLITLGNHEHRINRWVGENPTFEHDISIKDLGFEDTGFEVFPYGQYVSIAGFNFVHCIMGKTGRPAALNGMSNGYRKQGVSVVHGHTHTKEHFHEYHRGRRIHGIDLGCLIHKDMGAGESWSNPTEYTYWRGLWVFDNAANGDADFRSVRAETLGV